jgi:hypothetical protein
MCGVDNIKLFDLILGPVKIAVAVYIIYAG